MDDTAGVVNDGGDEGPLFTKHCDHPVEAIHSFAQNSLLFKPETERRFSSYGWILVSAAVEAAANQPFLAFMREQVFTSLVMRDTMRDPSAIELGEDFPLVNLVRELIYDPETRRRNAPDSTQPLPNRVTAYFPRFAATPKYGLHVMRPLDYSCYAGASVFVSTPSDLVRFGMAMSGGQGRLRTV